MGHAAAAGVLPHIFWDCTFRELAAAMRGARERDLRSLELAISQAWHTESFHRAKRLPPLDRVLKQLRGSKIKTPQELRNYFIALNEQMGGQVIDLRKKKD